ncbi:class II aldolase/adducin family protein [Sanguibacter suaedae]|uniref:Class II aldolase/adducin family protein n=1 Tax=Sanguibacter suaedae TaxID=2795737 RepID=A0A934IFB5_9MICO|nr:class II aldolase/adducin family protein [Sanguibacter suaedae]MBI9115914.1 class II aldolase/adducin family protein [Sanguibacter suaedae]
MTLTTPYPSPVVRSRASTALREEILGYCRESVRAGLNFNTQGNISVRLPSVEGEPDAIVITPSDVRYDQMVPADMVVVAMDGTVLEGDLLPSTELPVHLAHYRRRPDARAIVHTESTFVNVLGALGRRIDPVLLNMVLYAKGPVPVMPFEFSTNADFGRRSAELLGDDVNAVVWANHGLLAVGTSLKLAFKVAVAVEENAEVLHHASQAGEPRVLVYADIDVPEGARLP